MKTINEKEMHAKVQWRDLVGLNKKEKFIENFISLPWLIASLISGYYGLYYLSVIFSGIFFLAGLRLVHNGFHSSLGINKNLNSFLLFLHSPFMMVSIHAIGFNHMRHHQDCMGEHDQEGAAAYKTWYQSILYGPVHMFKVHYLTFSEGTRKTKRKALIDLILASIMLQLAIMFGLKFLIIHLAVMFFSEFLMAFFAVWMVHHDTADKPNFARTQRTKWKNILTFNMFYHLEHHIFPAVPSIKLPELSKRIDEALPELDKKITF